MTFLFARKRTCRRRNPGLAASLGLLSAAMLVGGGFLERYQGKHDGIILAAMVAALLVALGMICVVLRNREIG